jgi:hypothetical protein
MSRRIDTGDVEENTRPALENPKPADLSILSCSELSGLGSGCATSRCGEVI